MRSVWEQTYPNVELLVLDDGSPDRTGSILDRLKPISPIPMRVVHKQNEGICKTLNKGLQMTSGQYFCVLASDDKMYPDKISREVSFLKDTDSEVGACYTDMRAIDEDGVLGKLLSYAPVRPTNSAFLDVVLDRVMLSMQNATFKRAAVDLVGEFDESISFEDRDYLIRFVRMFKMIYIGGVGILYRIVRGSKTEQTFEDIQERFRIVEKYRNDVLFTSRQHSFRRVLSNEWVRLGLRSIEIMDKTSALRYGIEALRVDPRYPKAWRLIVVALVPARGSRFLLHAYHDIKCRLNTRLES